MVRRDGSLGLPPDIRKDLLRIFEQTWAHIARPGTWLSGAQRIAIVAEARMAQGCAQCERIGQSLSPAHVENDASNPSGVHATFGELLPEDVALVHRIRMDHSRLTRSWFNAEMDRGRSDTEYVETVSVIALSTALDTFSDIMAWPRQPLPDPKPGEPSRVRPSCTNNKLAWVPTIAPEDVSGEWADLYEAQSGAHIHQALSLVPAEKKAFFAVDDVMYLPDQALRRFDREYRAIDHAQIELLAARVSALNQCYY